MITLAKCELCNEEHRLYYGEGCPISDFANRLPGTDPYDHTQLVGIWNRFQAAIKKAKTAAWRDGHKTALEIQAEIHRELRKTR